MINLRLRGKRWWLWGDHCGVKIQQTTGSMDKAEAEKIRLQCVAEIERDNPELAKAYHIKQAAIATRKAQGITTPTRIRTVGDWRAVHKWQVRDAIKVYREDPMYNHSNKKLNTLKRYERLIGNLPLPLKRREAQHVMDVLESNATKTWTSNNTWNTNAKQVCAILNYVENNCQENDSPFRYECPQFNWKPEQLKDKFLTEDEAKEFLETCRYLMPAKLPLFTVSIYTGARPIELARLRWDDVHIANRAEDSSLILKSYKSGQGQPQLKLRAVPMHPLVYDTLSQVPTQYRLGAVFKTHDGRAYTCGIGQSPTFCGPGVFGKILNATGLPKDTVLYDFRHTFASWLRLKGEHLDTIAKLMGHSKVTTTQRYAHLSPDALNQSVQKLVAVT